MGIKRSSHFIFLFLFFFLVTSNVESHKLLNGFDFSIEIGEKSYARSSGGRSRGGSFKKRKSSPSKNNRKSSPSRNSNSPSRNSNSPSRDSNFDRNTPSAPINSPNTINNNNYRPNRSRGFGWGFLLPLLIFGGGGIFILALIILGSSASGSNNTNSDNSDNYNAGNPSNINKERDNDKVTVSKIQVALYAHTPNLQEDLSELSLRVDTDTDEGLYELMQESTLILLRNPEYWTHAVNVSESVHIDAAEQVFQKYSIAERSKFSQETLSNVVGNIKQRSYQMSEEEQDEIASYIVVTLILGTAHDRPLWDEIKTIDELQKALETLASIREDYLMVFELLWSPQSTEDSLTNDELLLEYTDMIQLV